ncbi:MAG: response regulator transcription factor [Undibacterium umbellatum]|uniref:response regulator transcription factor n=1 Tax=Undibacterium TaxID=401469 RepID=UPI003BB66CCA
MNESLTPAFSEEPITVVIAEDHALVRDGLKMLIRDILPHVEFVDASDAMTLSAAMAVQAQPHLALIDLNMPGMERGDALQDILSKWPQIPVVVVSALSSPDLVRRCLNLPSVCAFVSKNASAAQMKAAIKSSLEGGRPGFVQLSEPKQEAVVRLSPRLEEVRELLRMGMTNKSIAQQLNISEGTVKNYMSEIFKQLNVTNRTQAARFDEDLK